MLLTPLHKDSLLVGRMENEATVSPKVKVQRSNHIAMKKTTSPGNLERTLTVIQGRELDSGLTFQHWTLMKGNQPSRKNRTRQLDRILPNNHQNHQTYHSLDTQNKNKAFGGRLNHPRNGSRNNVQREQNLWFSLPLASLSKAGPGCVVGPRRTDGRVILLTGGWGGGDDYQRRLLLRKVRLRREGSMRA